MAFQLADAQSVRLPDQSTADVKPDVRLYSDGRVLDSDELQLQGNLTYDKIGTDTAPNIAIVALDAKRNYDQPTQVEVFARLANYGPKPANADVQLTVDGALRSIAAVSLPPDRWSDSTWIQNHPGDKDDNYAAHDSVSFSIDMPAAGIIRLEQMNHDGDLLSADNAAQVVVPPPKDLSVLLVTDGNYYLERMMNSLSLKNPAQMSPQLYEQKQPKDFDVVIFDHYFPQWMPDVGNFIFFGSVPPKANIKAEQLNNKYVLLDDVDVLDWQRDHPMLRHVPFAKMFAAHILKLDIPPTLKLSSKEPKAP